MPHAPKAETSSAPLDLPADGLRFVTVKAFKKFLLVLGARLGVKISVIGATRSQSGDNLTFEIPEQPAAAAALPLAVNADGSVAYSTILGVIPTIGGTAINHSTPPTLTLPGSGTYYVRATVTGTFTVTDSIFVHPDFASAPTVALSVESSASGGGGLISTSGVFTFDLATVVAGVPTNAGYGPISGTLIDDLTGAAQAALFLGWGGVS